MEKTEQTEQSIKLTVVENGEDLNLSIDILGMDDEIAIHLLMQAAETVARENLKRLGWTSEGIDAALAVMTGLDEPSA